MFRPEDDSVSPPGASGAGGSSTSAGGSSPPAGTSFFTRLLNELLGLRPVREQSGDEDRLSATAEVEDRERKKPADPLERWAQQQVDARVEPEAQAAETLDDLPDPRRPEPPSPTGRLPLGIREPGLPKNPGGAGQPPGPGEQGDEDNGDDVAGSGSAAGDDAAGSGPSAGDVRRAMLQDAGLSPGGSGTRGLGRSPDGPPAGPSNEYGGPSDKDWMIDGSYLGGLGRGSVRGPLHDTPLPAGTVLPLPNVELAKVGLVGYWPTDYPPDQQQALVLLTARVFGRAKQELVARVLHEPLFLYGRGQWRKERQAVESNRELLVAVYLRLARLTGAIYQFEPAPLFFTPLMAPRYVSYYDGETHRGYMSERFLAGAYADVLQSSVLIQMRAYHLHLRRALRQGGLDGELAHFAELIRLESRNRPASRPDFGDLRDHHAFDVANNVAYAILHAPQ